MGIILEVGRVGWTSRKPTQIWRGKGLYPKRNSVMPQKHSGIKALVLEHVSWKCHLRRIELEHLNTSCP
jgi:transposase